MKKMIIALIAILMTSSVLALGVIVGPFGSQEQASSAATDPVYYNELGYALAQAGDNDGAQAAFAYAVELDQDYERARSNLATIAFHNEDYETAIEQLRWLVAHDASNDDYQFDLAQNLVHQARYVDADLGKLDEAADIFESLGSYPNAAQNAVIVRNVIDEFD